MFKTLNHLISEKYLTERHKSDNEVRKVNRVQDSIDLKAKLDADLAELKQRDAQILALKDRRRSAREARMKLKLERAVEKRRLRNQQSLDLMAKYADKREAKLKERAEARAAAQREESSTTGEPLTDAVEVDESKVFVANESTLNVEESTEPTNSVDDDDGDMPSGFDIDISDMFGEDDDRFRDVTLEESAKKLF